MKDSPAALRRCSIDDAFIDIVPISMVLQRCGAGVIEGSSCGRSPFLERPHGFSFQRPLSRPVFADSRMESLLRERSINRVGLLARGAV
jgi:hypothetical protein